MKVKELVWEDVVTELGKEKDYFHLVSRIEEIDTSFHITNTKYFNSDISKDKFYLSCLSFEDFHEECKTVEEAKEKAQKLFEEIIKKLFFES